MEITNQKTSVRVMLHAGLLPLPWFILWLSAAGLAQPGYSALAQHGSELLASGEISSVFMRVAAMGSGIGFILFGFAVGKLSRQKLSLAAMTWIIFGLSMVSNGIWPMGTPMHGLYAAGVINLIAPAISHMELESWLDQPWHRQITALSSLAGVVYLWLNLTGNDPESLRGFTQRAFFSLFALWTFFISLSILRKSRVLV
ncbi:DUF998 domain-containing protein [Massilia sp. ML15P13]|uniref:DUF998 domain-containing protein n=2 Tax=Telluria aromaticivorans TaxID=2725995 RepID=A0A7Y2NZ34_9BURK|nr:DUF998 domain-containing protein [Telluria aromaticivorans]